MAGACLQLSEVLLTRARRRDQVVKDRPPTLRSGQRSTACWIEDIVAQGRRA